MTEQIKEQEFKATQTLEGNGSTYQQDTTVKSNSNVEGEDMQFDSSVLATYTDKSGNHSYSDSLVQINLVFDAGASQTRHLVLEAGKPVSSKSLSISDSRYALVDLEEDLSVYKKVSENISENGEYIITEDANSPFLEDSWFEETKRVIKGKLISKIGKTPRNIDNQRDKSDDIGIFVNMLTGIANVGLEHGAKNLKVRLGFPIPPKERYSDSERIETLKRTLAGRYTVTLPRYGYTCTIEIPVEDIMIEAEGEAAFIYYTTRGNSARARHEEYGDKLVTIQDLGSSTFNIALIREGSIQSGVSHTAKFGGENLVSKLYSILSRSHREPISFDQAKLAVETGYVMSGANRIPVGIELTKAKREVADILAKEYITFLQVAGLHSTAIYAHFFVGRGMLETGEIGADGEPTPDYSPSIGHILHQEYSKMSPNTKAIMVKQPGLANLLGIASLMKMQWKL